MPGETENETVTISLQDIKALERLAVVEAGHEILVKDFQKSRDHVDASLNKIFDIVNSIPSTITNTVTDCRNTLENDIKDTYMTQSAGKLLEQKLTSDTKSIKLWIVSTVTGCTTAGVFTLWLFKINPFY